MRSPAPLPTLLLLLHGGLAPVVAFGQIRSVRVASDLVRPVYVTAPAGDTERLFIVEQRGVIEILKNGAVLPQPFLDIRSRVNDTGNEQGLLGLAFHPDYATNGYFYVYYTNGFGAGNSIIRRYTVSSNPDSADENSTARVLKISQPFINHNGGQIEFGPDGYLYVGLGDGGSAGDPGNRAQNGAELLGKMLRIDVNGDDFPADTLQNYAIPPDNPFVGDPNFRDEIWAYGLRNPYRWSFDRSTGDLYIGDVGQNCTEEVDFQAASSTGGENYGWRLMEGSHCFNPADMNDCNPPGPCNDGTLILPIYDYEHFPQGGGFHCSVIGGYVYRGSAIPPLQGHYFFADYCSGAIWSFRYEGMSVNEFTDWTSSLAPGGGLSISEISAIGEDGLGELYVVDLGSATDNGEIYKIVPDSSSLGTGPTAPREGGFELLAGTPNPFLRSTRIHVRMDRAAPLRLGVYNARGRLVRRLHDGPAGPGVLSFEWTGCDGQGRPAPAGVYFVRAASEGRRAASRITLLR